jgi:predicted PurR-regulated permease PerM
MHCGFYVAYIVIQFVDNNFIVPAIVASKVKVNAFISIIVVIFGGALWGIAGMFLSIPLIAILKVIFDRIESMKPFGFLLGDDMPDSSRTIFHFRKIKK